MGVNEGARLYAEHRARKPEPHAPDASSENPSQRNKVDAGRDLYANRQRTSGATQ